MTKRVTLENLLNAKIIKAPFSIHARFKGQDFFAQIDKDGFVLLEGKRHTSLSVAGGIVRAKISGKPEDGLAYRRVNGWTFWRYIDDNGISKKMDYLRKLYKEEAGGICTMNVQ